jgi:hypothetical protein
MVTLSSFKENGDQRRFPTLEPPFGANLACLPGFLRTIQCRVDHLVATFSLTGGRQNLRGSKSDAPDTGAVANGSQVAAPSGLVLGCTSRRRKDLRLLLVVVLVDQCVWRHSLGEINGGSA